MNQEVCKKIEELSKPLTELLIKECDPYTEICISQDSIKVKQTIAGILVNEE